MAITRAINQSINVDGRTESAAVSVSSAASVSLDENIADSTTDGALTFTLDVSECKSLWIHSDQDLLLETNDGSTPDFSISLSAGIPFLWHESNYITNPITDDITALYATNSSGSTARLKIEAQYDPTP